MMLGSLRGVLMDSDDWYKACVKLYDDPDWPPQTRHWACRPCPAKYFCEESGEKRKPVPAVQPPDDWYKARVKLDDDEIKAHRAAHRAKLAKAAGKHYEDVWGR